ncbi:MAG: hypothetical protein HYV51_00850 [Parcubacteria group bacterium]|nr:hypothetical protein [Parcubacteria group bacterium]
MLNFPPKLSQTPILLEKFIINGGVSVIDPDSAWISPEISIGRGTVFCNYNGNKKHSIILGNYVFIGSGANLIAPITIGDYAYIAAGAIVSKNVKPYDLIIGVNKVTEGKKSYYWHDEDGWYIYPINKHPVVWKNQLNFVV